ncbi:MAG: SAM-dependent methyltransferase [Deferribacterota bacterium]|nr:SAM-dependent methyltransferase [Deferribacterota bacterium]
MDELKEIIKNKIKKTGKITFRDFMETALYHPKLGYYQKENPFGITGSYYTSVDASFAFGRSIAKSLIYVIDYFKLKPQLIEIGAGRGFLAKDILDFIKDVDNKLYNSLTYIIVERSEYLIGVQRDVLSNHKGRVLWCNLDDLHEFEGVIFSNELIDAFPVHRVINIDGEYKELYVVDHNDKLQFFPDNLSTSALKEYLEYLSINLKNKQIADINLDALAFLKRLSSLISKGFILTIDYGFLAKQLYSSFRMDGTVTCYFKHTQNNNFFERIGYQDITAFVDFSALIEYGKLFNLDCLAFMEQWKYLLLSSILEEIENAKSDLEKASIKSLIMPDVGFGSNFHVLMQAKNLKWGEDFKYLRSSANLFDDLLGNYIK